jgi:hypothetical protein
LKSTLWKRLPSFIAVNDSRSPSEVPAARSNSVVRVENVDGA